MRNNKNDSKRKIAFGYPMSRLFKKLKKKSIYSLKKIDLIYL